MRHIIATAALLATTSAVPLGYGSGPAKRSPSQGGFTFPLQNGFPNPNADQLCGIEFQAGGTLPNGAPPPTISQDGLTNLKLIAFNELFEVAFFTELLSNITNNVLGYEIPQGMSRDFVIEITQTVLAQEELHALNANNALSHFGAQPIQPCTYKFPVSTFSDAIALAGTFTDVVLGTLQDVTQIFANSNDNVLTRGIASVIGQEGEQEGFYRILQNKRPSQSPFLTTSVRDFAFTAIQGFTVPGSCPNINAIDLKTFQPLVLLTPPAAANSKIKFSFSAAGYSGPDYNSLSLVLINQQNVPVVESITVVSKDDNVVVFEADFPFESLVLNGLTISAVTNSMGPFTSADDVAKATLFGPAFIEVN